jgi:hypothetical protein
MQRIGVVAAMVGLGLVAWLLASRLSSDALGLAVGVVFGVLSGVPTALLVLAAGRQREGDARRRQDEDRPQQPPVVVMLAAPRETHPSQDTHYHYHAPAVQPQGAQPLARRDPYWDRVQPPPGQPRYRVVGEREDWVE